MTLSIGDKTRSWVKQDGIGPFPYIRVHADSAETKYISLRGISRADIATFTLATQAVGTQVVVSLTMYVPDNSKENPANFPWFASSTVADGTSSFVSPTYGLYAKIEFSGKGYAILMFL